MSKQMRLFLEVDLPPATRANLNSSKSVKMENDGHEEKLIRRRANHWAQQAG
jgi:hypothetical protein